MNGTAKTLMKRLIKMTSTSANAGRRQQDWRRMREYIISLRY
jgi:hypothetical protein